MISHKAAQHETLVFTFVQCVITPVLMMLSETVQGLWATASTASPHIETPKKSKGAFSFRCHRVCEPSDSTARLPNHFPHTGFLLCAKSNVCGSYEPQDATRLSNHICPSMMLMMRSSWPDVVSSLQDKDVLMITFKKLLDAIQSWFPLSQQLQWDSLSLP